MRGGPAPASDPDGPELTVVIPVFGEAAHIEDLLGAWSSTLQSLRIDYVLCVHDDGSRDATRAILERLAGADARIEVVSHENRGHGPTILDGYRRARGRWVLQVDGDGEIAPDHFPALWSPRDGYDLLLGSRRRSFQSPARRVLSATAGLAVRALFGRGIGDVNVPYRLMRASALRPLLERIPAGSFAPNLLLSGLAIRRGLRIHSHDVPVRARASGRSSLTGWRLWSGAWRSMVDVLRVALSTRHAR